MSDPESKPPSSFAPQFRTTLTEWLVLADSSIENARKKKHEGGPTQVASDSPPADAVEGTGRLFHLSEEGENQVVDGRDLDSGPPFLADPGPHSDGRLAADDNDADAVFFQNGGLSQESPSDLLGSFTPAKYQHVDERDEEGDEDPVVLPKRTKYAPFYALCFLAFGAAWFGVKYRFFFDFFHSTVVASDPPMTSESTSESERISAHSPSVGTVERFNPTIPPPSEQALEQRSMATVSSLPSVTPSGLPPTGGSRGLSFSPNLLAEKKMGDTPEKNVTQWLEDAWQFRSKQMVDEAQKAYENALKLDAKNPEALMGMAEIMASKGFSKKARSYLNQVNKPSLQTAAKLTKNNEEKKDMAADEKGDWPDQNDSIVGTGESTPESNSKPEGSNLGHSPDR